MNDSSEQGTAEMRRLIREVWEQEREGVLAGVDVLERAIGDALAEELGEERRQAARREAHKLAGSVGTFGFSQASERARELELALEPEGGPALEQLPRMADLVVAIRAELEAGIADEDGADGESAARSEGVPVAPEESASAPAEGELLGPVDLLVVIEDLERGRLIGVEADVRGLSWRLAQTPAAARELMAGSPPQLVLLDLETGGDGAAALEFLAEAAEERPVVVLTKEGGADRVEVARHGGRGFLSRELAPSELVDAIVVLRERLRTAGTRVLALDDDQIVLSSIASLLGAAGLEVSTTTDPARFWEELELRPPDLVMLDYDMPEVEGPEVCRALRNDPRWEALPVLFLTSRTDPDSVRRVFDAGADDYVSKPFVGPELIGRIANRLDRVRMMRTLADTDPLTGLANRRRSQEMLGTLCAMARRFDQPLCLALLDVDDFKTINDTGGHATGDEVLRALGALLTRTFRAEDVAARWGGDEFVIGMYGMAGVDGRERLGRFLEELRGAPIADGVEVTMSAGLAQFPDDGAELDSLYRAADAALYRAKEGGRDRVAAGPAATAERTVLDVVIVEDDEALGALLEHSLHTRGYTTARVTDGAEAAGRLAAADPSLTARLVLLDWDLPGIDGLRVLRAMRESGTLERTRVIMLTSRAGEGEVMKALEGGASDHVAKPFSVPVLMQRVRSALER
jgi:diguanylate cyclase (GGDEF)-like protein